jgi:FlaA1/EpsC-like NDP-sugar epimerase
MTYPGLDLSLSAQPFSKEKGFIDTSRKPVLSQTLIKLKDPFMRFEGKSVIITGGGGKIAKAYAMAFAKKGAKLSLLDIASADQIVKTIADMGGTAISMACDVSNESSVKAIVENTVKQFGTVDVLINKRLTS